MFNRFRSSSQQKQSSVRFKAQNEEEEDAKQEQEEDAKRMVRRPSLARRLSSTLLGSRMRSTSSTKDAEDPSAAASTPSVLLTWGRNDLNQLLRDARQDIELVHAWQARQIISLEWVALGFFHSLAISPNAAYGSGDNEEGQLDASRQSFSGAKPIRFTTDSIAPCSVAVGLNHSALVSKEGGTVLTWGNNEMGQLGRKTSAANASNMQQVEGAMRKERAVQVACTENATLVLTERGQVWSFGESTRGELGRPECAEEAFYLSSPVRGRLFCNPIQYVACGAGHVVALTQTGRALGWGWNRHGQLGFDGGQNRRFEPEPISLPLNNNISNADIIIDVKCGNQHTALQMANSIVLTAGSNDFGQLARASLAPPAAADGFRPIDFELEIASVACGAFHTLVLTKEDGHVYAVGSNEFGESNPDAAAEEAPSERWQLKRVSTLQASEIFAGGNASACILRQQEQQQRQRSRRKHNTAYVDQSLDCDTLEQIAKQAIQSKSLGTLKGALVGEFHCTGLNRSFASLTTESKVDCIKLVTSLGLVCDALLASKDGERFFQARCTALFEELALLAPIATEPDQLRCFLIALVHPGNAFIPTPVFVLLIKAMALLQSRALQRVMTWLFADFDADFVDKQVLQLLVRNADFCVQRRDWSRKSGAMPQTVHLIKALHLASKGRIPFARFYLAQPDAWPKDILFEEWSIYNKNKLLDADVYFSIFHYAMLLSAETKRNVLIFDSQNHQMHIAINAAIFHSGNPFLEITIRRNHLLQDALKSLSECKQSDLSKPIKVAFENEPGLDAGGVRKEFFELLSAELFTARATFRAVDRKMLWINPTGSTAQALRRLRPVLAQRNPHFTPLALCVDSYSCFAKCQGEEVDASMPAAAAAACSVCGYTNRPCGKRCVKCKYSACKQCIAAEQGLEAEMLIYHQLVLTGALMGLAVYNNTLLDVHFPVLLYAALLGKDQEFTPQLSDLAAFDSQLANSLQYMLDFKGTEEEFAQVFDGVFEEEDEKVTLGNKDEYVRKRVAFELKDGVRDIILAMKHGFESVLDVARNNAMQLLSAVELEMLIIGVSELNFADLKRNCKYEGGYEETTQVVAWFWELVLFDMTEEDKRLLLSFTTGSSHAPIGGLKHQDFLIQRAGPDTDQLPTSSTCFHTLLLPEYSTKTKLRDKLTIALRNAQGFGLQ